MSIINQTYIYDALNVKELLTEALFDIPAYQRGYAWEADVQVQQLLDDLRRGIEEDSYSLYFLGEVTVVRRTLSENRSVLYEVIDGQQRLSTLQMMFMVLHKQLNSVDAVQLDQAIDATATRNAYLTTPLTFKPEGSDDRKFRVQPATDGIEALEWLSDGKFEDSVSKVRDTPKLTTISQSRLVDAWQLIDEFLLTNFKSVEERLKLLDYLLNKIVVVLLCVSKPELALDIFWKSNGRGLPLTDADLLKNMLFIHSSEDQFQVIESHWKNTTEILYQSKRGKRDSMLPFLKMWGQILYGKNVGQSKVFEVWDRILAEGKAAGSPVHIDSTIEPVLLDDEKSRTQRTLSFAELLPNRARMLSNIILGKSPSGAIDFSNICIGSTQMKIYQHHEVLLAGWKLSESSYQNLLEIVEARVMLYQLSGERTQDFERILHPWSNSIAKLSPTATRQEILEASDLALSNLDALLDSMKTKIESLSYTTQTHRKILRYVLARAITYVQFKMYNEQGNSHQFLTDLILQQSITAGTLMPLIVQLDHIFPKSDAKAKEFESRLAIWLEELAQSGSTPEEISRYRNFNFLNSLGNLSLLKASENLEQLDDLPGAERKIGHYCGSAQKYLLNLAVSSEGTPDLGAEKWRNVYHELRAIANTELSSWGPGSIIQRSKLYLTILERDFRSQLG